MLLYIRHGNDETNGHRHDHRLARKGRFEVKYVTKRLIRQYGVPDIVYYSPMQRSVDTVAYMKKYLPKSKFIMDRTMSRFFSSKEQADPSVYPSTLKRKIPIYENKRTFRLRCIDRYQELRDSNKIIWCVTHALVMKAIAQITETKLPDHIPFMYSFRLFNDIEEHISNSKLKKKSLVR